MNNSVNTSLPAVFLAPVIHGKKLGRRLGAPTLNQNLPKELENLPHGVYFSRCTVSGVAYCAVTNVGTAPTVTENGALVAESHLFGLTEPIYGEEVRTELLFFHRPERKFDDVAALTAEIENDIRAASEFFSR